MWTTSGVKHQCEQSSWSGTSVKPLHGSLPRTSGDYSQPVESS